jgi:hypothetical protein
LFYNFFVVAAGKVIDAKKRPPATVETSKPSKNTKFDLFLDETIIID